MNQSRVQLDPLIVHSEDLGDIVGDFHGTPIRLWYPEETELRQRVDSYRIVIENRQREASK